jgi:hypothetical protein
MRTRNASTAPDANKSRSRRRRQYRDSRRHAHVLVAAQRDHGAEHGEPQKQDRRQFVRPHQRMAEHVTGNDATEENHDFGGDQECDGKLNEPAEPCIKRSDNAC